MNKWLKILSVTLVCSLFTSTIFAERVYQKQNPPRKLTAKQASVAEANYQKYCSLCHGADRQGHVNDHAPSLRSKSLFESGVPHAILRTLSYGRQGTAMGGYLDEVGGPMTLDETWNLTYWLFWQSGAQRVKLSEDEVAGDAIRGEVVYQENCANCHGINGEGITAPALGNQSALAYNKDEFIRYAIEKGREDTPMVGFSDKLSSQDIDNVTAFIRSKASGWTAETTVLQELPKPENYVLNPNNDGPNFNLTDDMFVSSKDLLSAMNAKKKMVLLDTRVTSVWQRGHLEGSIPFPYYTELDEKIKDLPKDVQIVGYCSCPRAAAVYLIEQLRDRGYSRTAVLYEGIFGWMKMGYPIMRAGSVIDGKTTGATSNH